MQTIYNQQGKKLSGNIGLPVKNSAKTAAQVAIKDKSYGLASTTNSISGGFSILK